MTPRPCPFCGQEAEVNHNEYTNWAIGCPVGFNPEAGVCRFHPVAFNFSFRSEAVAKWNGGLSKHEEITPPNDEVPF